MRRRRVKIVAIALLLWLAPAPWPVRAAEPAFVAGVDDLPLMPGLSEVPGAGVVFDKPSGRIVEAFATGTAISAGEVVRFYGTTLPQLGWRRISDLVYEREGERLRLTMNEEAGRLTLRFDLSPR